MDQSPAQQFEQSPKQKLSSSKAITITIVLIVLVVAFFIAKKTYQNNKTKTLTQKIDDSYKKDIDEIDIETVTPEQVNKYIRDKDVQLIDIREQVEYNLKHIESSINLPLSQIKNQIGSINSSKLVVIIDRKESTKGKILTDHLLSEGINTKYLAGGILAYGQAEYDLINIGTPTSNIDLLKVNSLSAQEIRKKLLSGQQIAFVDTRPALEYATDHIDGSINIPLEDLESKKNKLPIGRILVYDQEQIRSFRAAVRLYDMNVLPVYNCLDNYSDFKKILFEEKNTEDKSLKKEDQPASSK